MTRRTSESQTYAYTGDKAKGKGIGTFLKWTAISVGSAVAAGCGPQAITPQVEATPPAGLDPIKKDPTPNSTVEGPVSLDATPTPKIESNIPSPFEQAGLFYGSYGVDGSGKQVITGGIQSADFKANNPNSPYSVFGDENGTNVVNTLYSTTNPENTAATMLDQNTLDTLLHADTSKNGVTTGTLPDGSTVTKQGTSWVDDKGNVMITVVPSKEGRQFGFPLLVTDASGKLYIGITDGNGVLVEGEQFKPAFQSPADIAKEAGFTGPQNVARVNLTNGGILQIFDNQGKLLGEIKYVGNGKTFEDQINSAEDIAPEVLDPTVQAYARVLNVDSKTIQIHTEIINVNGSQYAFKLDQNGTPLFILNTEGAEAKWVPATLKNVTDIPGGLRRVGSENRMFTGFYDQINQATIGAYWTNVEPQQGVFNFTTFDQEVNEMMQNGIEVRGHGLVFPTSSWTMPEWLQDGDYTKEELKIIMENHIAQIIQHGKELGIHEWVVVNEPFLPIDRESDIFYQAYGNYDYVTDAFIAARKADPEAVLIFNDTDNHSSNGVTTKLTHQIISQLKTIKVQGEDGIERPILDAVGVQAHLGDWVPIPNSNDVTTTLNSYGLPIVITELDVNMVNIEGTPEQIAQKQAEAYANFIKAALDAGVEEITFWGLTDGNNWLIDQGKPGNADLFDANGQPKLAYYLVLSEIFKHTIQ